MRIILPFALVLCSLVTCSPRLHDVSSCTAELSGTVMSFLGRVSERDLWELAELCSLPWPSQTSAPGQILQSFQCIGDGNLPLLEEALLELGFDAETEQLLVDHQQQTQEIFKQEEGISVPLPNECFNSSMGPQIFWSHPFQPANGRHELHEFPSEAVKLQLGLCVAEGYRGRLDDCKVWFQSPFDVMEDTLQHVCCDGSCGSDWKKTGGAWVRQCAGVQYSDYPPGTWQSNAVLRCAGAAERNASLDMMVWWQQQPWTEGATAEGAGLREAVEGEEAWFEVQMVDRQGRRKRSGGDHLHVLLSGPAILVAAVQDRGDGTYRVAYTPRDPGQYDLEVLVTYDADSALRDVFPGGLEPREVVYAHIAGSPFSLAVRGAPQEAERAAPYQAKRRCGGAEAMRAEGRWVDTKACEARGRAGGEGAGCALGRMFNVQQAHYLWVNNDCDLRLYSRDRLLRCAAARGMRKVVIGGTSIQRTLFYDFSIMLNATKEVDVTKKAHNDMRFRVALADGTVLEFVFLWLMVNRSPEKAENTVQQYREMAQHTLDAVQEEQLGAGDLLIVGTSPYDVFRRPIGPVEEGSRVIVEALKNISQAPDAPTVVFRNSDQTHLPWLSFGVGMWGPNNGISMPRSEQVHRLYRAALEEFGVLELDGRAPTAGRSDLTHDGLHYYTMTARHAQLVVGMKLMSNEAGLTILQLFLNGICNDVVK